MAVTPFSLQYQYNALYKPNQLICGTGRTCIVTGWTVKTVVAKHLQPHEFAAIGNLYSPTRGINFLIRNLLANPHVRYLVVLNGTREDRNSGGGKCLLDFFHHGFEAGTSDTGRECWTIASDVPGYIDGEVEDLALHGLRNSIEVREAHSVAETAEFVRSWAREDGGKCGLGVSPSEAIFQDKPPFVPREPQIFPMAEVVPTVLPGPRYGHRIEGRTIAETWVKIVHRIKTTGTIRPTGYDGKWQELIDLVAVVTDEPEGFYFPEPNYLPLDRPFLEEYIGQILDDALKREGVKYTYGQRLRSHFGRDQIEQVIEKLIGEIDAASAVMSLWDVSDHERGGSPCLNHIWVRVVPTERVKDGGIDGEISLTALFRSNDMFAAWPANAMGLRALQQHIRDEIQSRSEYRLSLGPLITISQSAHIYDDTWENADRLIASQYASICRQPTYDDPCGNFLVEVENGEILVLQTTPGSGEVVAQYRGKNPLKVVREIANRSPAIQPDHIGYLGIELQKAIDAIQNNREYRQDR